MRKVTVSKALAKLNRKPTAAELLQICKDAGMRLAVVDGRVVGPKGIAPEQLALLDEHSADLVKLLQAPKKPADAAPAARTQPAAAPAK